MSDEVEIHFGATTDGLDEASDQSVKDIQKVQEAQRVASEAIASYQAKVTAAVEAATRQQELANIQAAAAITRASETAVIAVNRQIEAEERLKATKAVVSTAQASGADVTPAMTRAVDQAQAAYNRQSDAAMRASQAVQVAEENAARVAEQSATRVANAKSKLEAVAQRQADVEAKAASQIAAIQEKAEAQRAAAIKKAADAAVKAREEEAARVQKAAQKEADAVWAAWQKEQEATEKAIAAAKKRSEADEAAAQKAQNAYNRVGSSMADFGKKLGLSGNATQNLSYQINDVVSGLLSGQRPFQILMQQGPQITQAFGGVGKTMTALRGILFGSVGVWLAVAAAVGLAIKAAWDYTKAQDEVKASLVGAGAASGLTRDQFNDLAESAAKAGDVSVAAARNMGIAFLNTGKIGGEMFGKLVGLSKDYQFAMGVNAKQATTDLGAAFADPIKGAADLNDKLGFLDYKTQQHIKDLVEQGRQLEAQQLLFDRLSQRLAGAADQANWLAKAWDSVATAASNAWNAMGQALTGGSDAQKLADLQARRQRVQNDRDALPKWMQGYDNSTLAWYDKEIAKINERGAAAKKAEQDIATNRKSQQIGSLVDTIGPKASQVQSLQNQITALQDLSKDSAALSASGKTQAEVNGAIAEAQRKIVQLQKLPKTQYGQGKGPASDFQMWQEQLQQMTITSGDFFANQTEAELKFWQTKLGLTKTGTKEWVQVQTQIYNAQKTLATEGAQEEMANFDFRIQQAGLNKDAALAIENEKLARVKTLWGEESKQFRDEQRRQVAMVQDAEQEKLRIQQTALQQKMNAAIDSARTDSEIAAAEANAAQQHIEAMASMRMITDITAISMRNDTARKLIQIQMDQADKEYQIKLKELQDELALENLKPEARAKINSEIEALEAAHANNMRSLTVQMTNADKTAADQRLQAQRAVVAPWTEAATQMFTSWAAGVQTLGDAWNQFGRFILQKMTQWCADIVTNWVMAQLGMTTATATGVATRTATEAAGAAATKGISATSALVQIGHKAAVAAAGAYSAIASIPFVGPVLAPIAAAAALAGVLAIGQRIFSARGGKDRVANDGDMYELHKDETVLSAPFANGLRNMISNFSQFTPGNVGGTSAASAAASAGREARSQTTNNASGDNHFNYSPTVNAPPSRTLDQLLSEEGSTMRKWMRIQFRENNFKGA